MRYLKPLLIAAFSMVAVEAQATQQWSSCQTIVGVSNYLAYANGILLGLSPGISGCSANGVGGALFIAVGVNGVTTANITSFLASSLAAYTAGHQVMIFYDDSAATQCAGIIIANGGYNGQCP